MFFNVSKKSQFEPEIYRITDILVTLTMKYFYFDMKKN